MVHFGGADDGGVDVRLAQDPCQGDLRAGYTAFFGDLPGAICHSEIFFTEIESFCKRVTISTGCCSTTFACAVACEESPCHRTPWDESDSLVNAQGDHLAFLLTIDKVVVILHGRKLCP